MTECKKCGGLGKVETMVDCECVKEIEALKAINLALTNLHNESCEIKLGKTVLKEGFEIDNT